MTAGGRREGGGLMDTRRRRVLLWLSEESVVPGAASRRRWTGEPAEKERAMPGPGMELIGEEEIAQVMEVMRSGHLSRYGSADDPRFKAKVYQLEQAVAKLSGVRYGVAVNSGTTAL